MHRFNLRHFFICFFVSVIIFAQATIADDLKDAKDKRGEVINKIEQVTFEKKVKEEQLKEKEITKNEISIKIELTNEALLDATKVYGLVLDDLKEAQNMVVCAKLDYEEKTQTAKESILKIYKNSKKTYVSILANSENPTGIISVAAFSFMVQEPRDIME